MTKNKSNKLKGETKALFTFPHLNQEIADAVAEYIPSTWFNRKLDQPPLRMRSTNVIGRFTCDNASCSTRSWSSGIVSIVIKGYEDNGYNAVVYNQRCKSCKRLGSLTLDEGCYVERVAYWLKKWAGVEMERPVHAIKSTPPHKSDLCEGCKAGYCRQGRSLEYQMSGLSI
ncbi:hypothetical protein C8034_v003182 [Colletotrichum sidae]|uniref:3CxxC-type domain-containing protein n=1 Tax=Colletotrichum sidae TaxID=1347389 RepID=A0A4R8TAA6_9PEZI|nr:hypothetical protein C8034_v003182 [Colletotrichum sidae]